MQLKSFQQFIFEATGATESAIKNLKRHVKEKARGSLPYYEIPITQAKALEKSGYIIRSSFGSIELTPAGEDLIKESVDDWKSKFSVVKSDATYGDGYSLSLYDLSKTSNQELGRTIFKDKLTANKALKLLIKNGNISKRGYDYFDTENPSIEVRTNY